GRAPSGRALSGRAPAGRRAAGRGRRRGLPREGDGVPREPPEWEDGSGSMPEAWGSSEGRTSMRRECATRTLADLNRNFRPAARRRGSRTDFSIRLLPRSTKRRIGKSVLRAKKGGGPFGSLTGPSRSAIYQDEGFCHRRFPVDSPLSPSTTIT